MTKCCFKTEHEEPNAEVLSNKWLVNNAITLYTPRFYFILFLIYCLTIENIYFTQPGLAL